MTSTWFLTQPPCPPNLPSSGTIRVIGTGNMFVGHREGVDNNRCGEVRPTHLTRAHVHCPGQVIIVLAR
ncbi:hypothetical protein E2C01_087100 [Portunus trituberculatus]|uniref:Uncharacterized protein n=1 Tax=Portunus trituberculatus TaxID=210409 RepID=A0A5B7J5N3_PORTR|nr:hypothetical protein [Portunus trituberculatus]